MRGDRLRIEDRHRHAAEEVRRLLDAASTRRTTPWAISIGGESGSGKSELVRALADQYESRGRKVLLLQQDDYFVLPPKSNDAKRRQDLGWVGVQEVRLDLLDRHLAALRNGDDRLTKPLVDYGADQILEETLCAKGAEIVIVEGTYTTTLGNVDCRVFIDRTYEQTAADRSRRGRDAQDDFIERVLEIEHEIIAQQISRADIVITSSFDVAVSADSHAEG